MTEKGNFTGYQIIPANINEPHMPVILLLDCSGSMGIDDCLPINNLNAAVNRFITIIAEDSLAGNLVDICIIPFNHMPEVAQNWRPINTAEKISLTASGGTNLSDALELATSMLKERCHLYEDAGISVKMPYIVLITDGYGGDVTDVAEVIRQRTAEKKLKLWTLCVDGYDKATIAKLSGGKRVFELTDPAFDFSEFFDFMGESIKVVSTSAPGAEITVKSNIGQEGSTCVVPDLSDWLNN